MKDYSSKPVQGDGPADNLTLCPCRTVKTSPPVQVYLDL